MSPTPNDTALLMRLNDELMYKRELLRMIRVGQIDAAIARRMLAAYWAREGVLS